MSPRHAADQPGCSHWESTATNERDFVQSSISPQVENIAVWQNCQNPQDDNDNITPGKMLDLMSPIPKINENVSNVKKRGRALAKLLTSPEHIAIRKTYKTNLNKNKLKETTKKAKMTKKNTQKKLSKKKVVLSSSSESEGELSLKDDSDTPEEWEESDCAGCGENYNVTKKTDDWVRCIICTRWLHESCLRFKNMCDRCGKKSA